MSAYTSGDMEEAVKLADKKAENRAGTGDELMWRLEQAKIKFDAGDYKGSLSIFEKCEQLIKEFDDRAAINAREAGAEVGAAFTNQNALPYSGFNYDRILLNTYKALGYYALGDPNGAGVEMRRAYERQKEAEKKFADEIKKKDEENQKEAAKAGQNVSFETVQGEHPEVKKSYDDMKAMSNKTYGALMNPFVTYMSGIRYMMDGNVAEAEVDFRNLYKMDVENKLAQQYYVTLANRMGSKVPKEISSVKPFDFSLSGNVVYVIFENGLVPALKEQKFELILPTGYSGIAYSELEFYNPTLGGVEVKDSSGKVYRTATISAMNSVVSQEYQEIFPGMITRLVISTLIKEGATAAAYVAASQAGDATATTLAVIGVWITTSIYKYTFNTADTRCWQTLPCEYQVTQLPRPKDGILKLSTFSKDGTMVSAEPMEIKIEKSKSIVHVRHIQGNINVRVFEFE